MAEIFISTLQEAPGEKTRSADGLLQSFLTDLDARGRSKNTADAYRLALQRYLRHLTAEGLTPCSVSKEDLRQYLLTLADRPSAKYSATIAIRVFHAFLMRTGQVSSDPAAGFIPQCPPLPPRTVLNQDEVKALLNAPVSGRRNNFRTDRNKIMLLLLYATGIRPSELSGLKESDIDWSRRSITVRGKGNRMRGISFPPQLELPLKSYIEKKREIFGDRPWVILNFRGKKMSRYGILFEVKKMAAAVGLGDRVSPVILRHTFATHLMWGGADLRSIQNLLGHRHLYTTEIYTQLDDGHVQKTYVQAHPLANGQLEARHG